MQKRSFSDIEHHNLQEQSEVSSAFDRFFIMWSEDQTRPTDKLSPFVIDKAIKCTIGTLKSIKKLRSGDFLLEVSSATESRQMNKLKSIMDRPVTVTPHRSLNSCKGMIRCKELIDCDKQEMLSELKSQAVSDITNITVKDSSGGRKKHQNFHSHIQTNHNSAAHKNRLFEGSSQSLHS